MTDARDMSAELTSIIGGESHEQARDSMAH